MPALLPLKESCTPRPAEQTRQNYAADLHRALDEEIGNPEAATEFFASTYATGAMRRVASGIFDRLKNGDASNTPAVIRFNSVFGGGKTHTLIALAAAAKHSQLIREAATGGLIPDNLAVDNVRLICFTGENADVLRGMTMTGTDRRAKSLTGYLAYHLSGETAYDELKQYDDMFTDPGAEGFQKLLGNQPTLILLDELVRWVAAASQLDSDIRRAGNGLRNALTAIAKAVSNSPRTVLVITTPEASHDAYREEAQEVHQIMRDVDSVLSRTSQDYTPTETADFPAILRRRLFTNAETSPQRNAVSDAYAAIWHRRNPSDTEARQRFYDCYPFHPETLSVITERLANNNDFQRVRGTLRAAAAVINSGPDITEPLIHPYHLDVSIPEVREELVNRTGHQALDAAIEADITGPRATAQSFGETARRAANTILLGSLAPTANNGLADTEIVNGLISPSQPDASVADQAVQYMKHNGLFIDDHPDAGTTRFSRQANVRREVERRADAISEDRREDGLREAIRKLFEDNNKLGVTVFPSRTNNVPDDPDLVHIGIVNPNHFTSQSPDLDQQLDEFYRHNSGNGGNATREYRNNVLFLVPDHGDLTEIKNQLARHSAAAEMLEIDKREPKLLEYQRSTLEIISAASNKAVQHGIQRNWVNLYYPEPSIQPHGLEKFHFRNIDQVGRGQEPIIDFLASNNVGKMAHPVNPALNEDVWAGTGLNQAADAGMTVGEIHDRFTRTPGRIMFLKRAHFDHALDTANQSGIVIIRTIMGLDIKSGSGIQYRDDMKIWLSQYAPQPEPTKTPEPETDTPNENQDKVEEPGPTYIPKFRSKPDTGLVAVAELQNRMRSDNLDWANIASARLYGTTIAMLNDMASKAESSGAALSITYEFEANGFMVQASGKTAEEWQKCQRACDQMQRAAGAKIVDAQISITDQPEAARTMLSNLDNTHQVTLEVDFRQPNA